MSTLHDLARTLDDTPEDESLAARFANECSHVGALDELLAVATQYPSERSIVIPALQRALSLDPANLRALELLATAHIAFHETPEATTIVRHLHALAPTNPRAFDLALQLRYPPDFFGEIERLAQQWLALDPANAEATCYLAKSFAIRGKTTEAISVLDHALETLSHSESPSDIAMMRAARDAIVRGITIADPDFTWP